MTSVHSSTDVIGAFMRHVHINPLNQQYAIDTSNVFKASYMQKFAPNEFGQFFIQQITTLAKNSEGLKLLKLACALFNTVNCTNPRSKLFVSFSADNSAFVGIKERFSLQLNINLISDNTFWHKTLGLCTSVPALCAIETPEGSEPIVYITTCADPFWMLIAHELIHMTHYMSSYLNNFCCNYIFNNLSEAEIEMKQIDIAQKIQNLQSVFGKQKSYFACIDIINEILKTNLNDLGEIKKLFNFFNKADRLHARYNYATTVSPLAFVNTQGQQIANFPDLTGRNLTSELCEKLEERQTIIGPAISELTIRLVGGLPIRYIYQSANEPTYEYLSTVASAIWPAMTNRKIQNNLEFQQIVSN